MFLSFHFTEGKKCIFKLSYIKSYQIIIYIHIQVYSQRKIPYLKISFNVKKKKNRSINFSLRQNSAMYPYNL